MPRIKRKSGGQPGNQNARKHGFYSRRLSPGLPAPPLSSRAPRIDAEIALLRLKIASIIRDGPDNSDVILRAMSSLDRLVRTRYEVTRRQRRSPGPVRRRTPDELNSGRIVPLDG